MKMKFLNLFLLTSLLCSTAVFGAGNSAYQFLKFGRSARAIGLGEAYNSVQGEIDALYYNPAGVYSLKNIEFMAMYTFLHQDMSLLNFAGKYKLSPAAGDLALAVTAMLYGQLEGTMYGSGGELEKTDSFKLSSFEIIANYSRDIARRIYLGANIKTVIGSLGTDPDSLEDHRNLNLAFDAGSILNFGIFTPILTPLNLGLSVKNISYRVKAAEGEGYLLPLTFRAGINYRHWLNPKHELLYALDMEYINDKPVGVNIGLRYLLIKMIDIRVGFKTSDLKYGINLGTGFAIRDLRLDYSLNFVELGPANRIELSWGMPFKKKEVSTEALYFAGLEAFAAGNYERARDLMEKLLLLEPDNDKAAARIKEIDEIVKKAKNLKTFEDAMTEIK